MLNSVELFMAKKEIFEIEINKMNIKELKIHLLYAYGYIEIIEQIRQTE